jgi:NADH:ubiquinone oxidoreductase subunit 6 (subunit J)
MQLFADSATSLTGIWRLLLPLIAAGAAVYFLLPRPRGRAVLWGSICAIVALAASASLLFRFEHGPKVEAFLFFAFSGMAVISGGLLIVQSNPARGALCFAMVVINVCGLFLLQAAPFLMAATIIIYAGAIIVTFLFVLMLAQQTGFSDADHRSREPFLASFTGCFMLGALLLMLDRTFPNPEPFDELLNRLESAAAKQSAGEMRAALGDRKELTAQLERRMRPMPGSALSAEWQSGVDDLEEALGDGNISAADLRARTNLLVRIGRDARRRRELPAENVAAIGRLLFSDYLLAVELGGTLLLVAAIGAIAVAHRRERRPE